MERVHTDGHPPRPVTVPEMSTVATMSPPGIGHVVPPETTNIPKLTQPNRIQGKTAEVMAADKPVPSVTDTRMLQKESVLKIERCWCAYRDNQMYRLLKHAIRAAEHTMVDDIMRKVCPLEAGLLKDPSFNAKIRFRFTGSEFPPVILFKIFTNSTCMPVQYYHGRKAIKPASDAAKDALKMMGNRKFYDQLINDAYQYDKHKITDECDVTTLKDYMHYNSVLDETPAYLGGRDNLWRRLTLETVPRHTILYDIIDYAMSDRKELSADLRNEMPLLTSQPLTQEIQLDQINTISRVKSPVRSPQSSARSAFLTRHVNTPNTQLSSRRSKQARQRAVRMKKSYLADTRESSRATLVREDTGTTVSHGYGDHTDRGLSSGMTSSRGPPPIDVIITDKGTVVDTQHHTTEDTWEKEADNLYKWSQNLSFDDISVFTPR